EHLQLTDQIAIPPPGIHIITRMYALTESGHFAEASRLATAVYESMDASDAADGFMWVAFQNGRCALLQGKPVTARRWLLEARARCEPHSLLPPIRLVPSALAVADAYLGDAQDAVDAVTELDKVPPQGFHEPEQEVGRAWARAAAGDLPGARAILRAAADLA